MPSLGGADAKDPPARANTEHRTCGIAFTSS